MQARCVRDGVLLSVMLCLERHLSWCRNEDDVTRVWGDASVTRFYHFYFFSCGWRIAVSDTEFPQPVCSRLRIETYDCLVQNSTSRSLCFYHFPGANKCNSCVFLVWPGRNTAISSLSLCYPYLRLNLWTLEHSLVLCTWIPGLPSSGALLLFGSSTWPAPADVPPWWRWG